MNEKIIKLDVSENKAEKERKKEKIREEMIDLARDLGERREKKFFPGISPETYTRMKATDEEFPGYTTPIDELLKRLKNEGMKIVLGKNPEKGAVYILPFDSDDVETDGVFPEQLEVNEMMDEKLKTLIEKRKEFVALCKE